MFLSHISQFLHSFIFSFFSFHLFTLFICFNGLFHTHSLVKPLLEQSPESMSDSKLVNKKSSLHEMRLLLLQAVKVCAYECKHLRRLRTSFCIVEAESWACSPMLRRSCLWWWRAHFTVQTKAFCCSTQTTTTPSNGETHTLRWSRLASSSATSHSRI